MAKLALLGAGLVGRRHAEMMAAHGHLGCIVDPDPAARGLAEHLGVPWAPQPEAMLAIGGVQGVVIATPNQMHMTHGLLCVAAGLPILVEKPIADTSDNGARLVAAAEAAGVPVLVGHHRRHNPLVAAAKAAIDAGRLGDITLVNAQFWVYKPEEYFAQDWRRQQGAGPVYINLIHDIDLLRHLCGEILRVTARQSSKARGFAVEDTAVMLLEFANGALGTVSVSDSVVAPWSWEFASGENPAYPKTEGPCYMIGGTQAALSVPDLTLWTQPQGHSWWKPIVPERLSAPAKDPLKAQLSHFVEVVAGRAPPLVSGREGLRTLRVVEAIKRAAETGAPQEVSQEGALA